MLQAKINISRNVPCRVGEIPGKYSCLCTSDGANSMIVAEDVVAGAELAFTSYANTLVLLE